MDPVGIEGIVQTAMLRDRSVRYAVPPRHVAWQDEQLGSMPLTWKTSETPLMTLEIPFETLVIPFETLERREVVEDVHRGMDSLLVASLTLPLGTCVPPLEEASVGT